MKPPLAESRPVPKATDGASQTFNKGHAYSYFHPWENPPATRDFDLLHSLVGVVGDVDINADGFSVVIDL